VRLLGELGADRRILIGPNVCHPSVVVLVDRYHVADVREFSVGALVDAGTACGAVLLNELHVVGLGTAHRRRAYGSCVSDRLLTAEERR
jgi:hypothetical protein